ncbi:hypothetical protein [Streptomyces gobiensis]|nr:hypothetical protein [Streptomyces gobiensis]UGY92784.1 hypothetical protein test1122_14375 [Streptomyces gobiensis]
MRAAVRAARPRVGHRDVATLPLTDADRLHAALHEPTHTLAAADRR